MRLNILLVLVLVFITAGVFGISGCTVGVQPSSEPGPGRYYQPPPGQVRVDISFFYDRLAPYGEWFELQGYGWVWTPNDVPYGWRPYTHGRWVYTDFGWTWVSDWEWGWAPFHYGRWLYDPNYGWVWVPGREWAPACVAWQYGNGWVGWAPLPPHVGWQVGANINVHIKPHWWCFTEERFLLEPNLRSNIVLPARNVTFLNITQNVTNYTIIQNRVVNRSISVEQVERSVRRPIPRYNIVDRDTAPSARDRLKGNEVQMFRQPIAEASPTRTPSRVEPPKATERPDRRTGAGAPPGQRPSQQEIFQRQESDRRQLNTRHQEERTKLEEEHRRERQRPPTWISPREIQKQHEAERRALEEQQEQEKKSLQQRHEREQKGEGRSR
ncbi:MAG: cell envelope integrity protein TolA [Syntrophaceae bacterium]|nr:cell envelope integrity protein TolA [Syntrophaceae bacterium]